MVAALEWLRGAATFVDLWQRSVVVSTATFGGYLVLSTAAKWLLVGRFTADDFPLWGARYLRFWIVQRILRANPLAVFVGSPLYNLYLRCLGARVGAGAVVLTRARPGVCGPAHDRRRHDRPQGHASQRLSGRRRAHPDRARSRSAPDVVVGEQVGARHRDRAGRPRPARARVVAADRAGGAGRRELARLARRPVRRRLPAGRAGTVRPACAGSSTGCGSWPTSWSCPSRSASPWSCSSSSASRCSRG